MSTIEAKLDLGEEAPKIVRCDMLIERHGTSDCCPVAFDRIVSDTREIVKPPFVVDSDVIPTVGSKRTVAQVIVGHDNRAREYKAIDHA